MNLKATSLKSSISIFLCLFFIFPFNGSHKSTNEIIYIPDFIRETKCMFYDKIYKNDDRDSEIFGFLEIPEVTSSIFPFVGIVLIISVIFYILTRFGIIKEDIPIRTQIEEDPREIDIRTLLPKENKVNLVKAKESKPENIKPEQEEKKPKENIDPVLDEEPEAEPYEKIDKIPEEIFNKLSDPRAIKILEIPLPQSLE